MTFSKSLKNIFQKKNNVTIQQLATKAREISRLALERYATFSPNQVHIAYAFIESKLLDELKELLDEACKSSEIEPFTRSELRRFRKHLSKVNMEMEDQYTDPGSNSMLLSLIKWEAEAAVKQIEELLGKAERGELKEGECEDWGLDCWEDYPEDCPELAWT